MSARLTRQEMKRDEVMESIGSFVRFLWTHPKGILLSLCTVLLVALAWVAIAQLRKHRVERANAALTEALRGLDESAQPAQRRQGLQRVIDEYGSTGAAAAARLLLAAAAASSGNVERAVELWNQVGERQDSLLAMEAELNLIEHLRAAGRGEEVVERLRRELDQGSGALPADAVMGQLAATLEDLGRGDEADTVRQQLRERHPESPWLREDAARGQGAPASLR
ncbi:MAG: tetratricopeptide repeat protein [Thermoanaerobaculia bacterium]